MSITAHAKSELEMAGLPEAERKVLLDQLAAFFGEYDSGGAVWGDAGRFAAPTPPSVCRQAAQPTDRRR